MAYDWEYFQRYSSYLKEPTVRTAHDGVLGMFLTHYNATTARLGLDFEGGPGVADLGCGQAYEFPTYVNTYRYVGFDLNPGDNRFYTAYRKDYRSEDFIEFLNSQPLFEDLNVFVSLFSSEITAPFDTNTKLYEHLFREVPYFRFGLVSGFYYTDNKAPCIKETGDVVSWQTLEPLESGRSDVYDEIRIVLPVPSQMFGPNVVEVWRILTRKAH